jgi:hypothetical protein
MSAPAARIDKGTFTRSNGANETGLHVESITFTSTREEVFYPSIVNGCDVIGDYANPSGEWKIDGIVKAVSDFATQHVGSAVTSLANFAAETAGCDPAQGVMIFKDPSHSWTPKKPRTLSFGVLWKPFIA